MIQHNSAPFNMTCQSYSHLSAMNAPIPTALSSLSQSVDIISSMSVIASKMIKLVSKILASFYAFGFCVTALAFVGFLRTPGGGMRTICSAIFSCVSRISQVAHYANSQSQLAFLVYGFASAFVTSATYFSHLTTQELGHGNGVATSTGRSYLALSWITVAMMLIASFAGTWFAILPSSALR